MWLGALLTAAVVVAQVSGVRWLKSLESAALVLRSHPGERHAGDHQDGDDEGTEFDLE